MNVMFANDVIGKQKVTLRNGKGLRGRKAIEAVQKAGLQPFHVPRSGLRLGRRKVIIVSPSANHR
jgi:hypothetical protein